jgi:hypothetical protein
MENKNPLSLRSGLKKWSADIKEKNKKTILVTILILYALIYTIYSLSVIHHKNKFEVSYNIEYYSDFLYSFLQKDSSTDRYVDTLDKVVFTQPLGMNDIEPVMHFGGRINYVQNSLCNFYREHYKKDERINNLYYLSSFFSDTWLYESYFKKTNSGQYVMNTKGLNELNNYYIGLKAEAVSKILSEFKSRHKEYFDDLYSERGKSFVRDGVWIELFYNINEKLKEIERDYDFGAHAPNMPELRKIDNFTSPRDVQYFSLNHYDALKLSKIYSVIDTESGVYFYYGATGERKIFEVESFKSKGNQITVVIDEGDYTPDSGTGGIIYNTFLIRGIKPGEAKNYSFRVVNTRGEEFKRIEN